MATSPIGPLQYTLTFVALALLATASLLFGIFLKVPYWDVVIGLGLATIKAVLVLWYFMHIGEQPFRTRLVTAVSVLLVILLISFTTIDVATRDHIPPRSLPGPQESFYLR